MNLSDSAIQWLANGERGLSSEAMFTHLTGIDAMRGWSGMPVPSDPDDFKRCEKLLRQCPELRPLLPNMADVSARWAALVAHWDDVLASLLSEIPNVFEDCRSNAPRTYALMRSIYEEADR